ncbi:hypothetical protein LTR74_009888 [Friedmanniomyces endolithicus]|nr:hypothetical protein LTR74_009888 [Friedmanniomyces endolithicus]
MTTNVTLPPLYTPSSNSEKCEAWQNKVNWLALISCQREELTSTFINIGGNAPAIHAPPCPASLSASTTLRLIVAIDFATLGPYHISRNVDLRNQLNSFVADVWRDKPLPDRTPYTRSPEASNNQVELPQTLNVTHTRARSDPRRQLLLLRHVSRRKQAIRRQPQYQIYSHRDVELRGRATRPYYAAMGAD